jgi:hypothetical protein
MFIIYDTVEAKCLISQHNQPTMTPDLLVVSMESMVIVLHAPVHLSLMCATHHPLTASSAGPICISSFH